MKFMDVEEKNSEVVILPVKYEGDVTWGKGAALGAEAILEASKNLEYYDVPTNSEPVHKGIFTLPILDLVDKDPEEAIIAIKEKVNEFKDKFLIIIGGDHSVGIGALPEGNYSTLQFDAHPDLFYSWNNSKFNHRCFGHYANDSSNGLVQVGIRSMDVDEVSIIKEKNICVISPEDLNNDFEKSCKKVLDNLKEEVFISLDVDVFDPSFIRNTGTPEPGGLSWYQVLDIIKAVFKNKKVIGFQLCEFAPIANYEAEAYALAKLIYHVIGLYYKK